MKKITKSNTRLGLAPSLLLTVSLAFFSAFCAFPEVILYRYTVVMVFALLLLLAVRSRLVLALSILPCLFALLFAEISAAPTLLLCAIAWIGFGGFAVTAIHPALLVAAPASAYLLAYGVTGDPIVSLASLAFLPPTLVCGLVLRRKLSRTASIVAVATALLLELAALLLLCLPEGFTFSAETFSALVESTRRAVTDALKAVAATEEYAAMLAGTPEEMATLFVNSLFRLLPAIVIVFAELVAYFGCRIALTLKMTHFPEDRMPSAAVVFRMSVPSALLFLTCLVLSLLPTGRSDFFGVLLVSAVNLFVILLPGLALCGANRILLPLRKKRVFPIFVLVLLCLWLPTLVPTLLAIVGAFSILRLEKSRRKNRKK